jgi:hypothetical protein
MDMVTKDFASPTFIGIYFVVWTALAIGAAILFAIRRDAEFRIRWHGRIVFWISLTIGFFMFLAIPRWHTLIFILIFGGLITYLNLAMTTICRKCGRIIRAPKLIQAAKFCSHCGSETVRSKIFHH